MTNMIINSIIFINFIILVVITKNNMVSSSCAAFGK